MKRDLPEELQPKTIQVLAGEDLEAGDMVTVQRIATVDVAVKPGSDFPEPEVVVCAARLN